MMMQQVVLVEDNGLRQMIANGLRGPPSHANGELMMIVSTSEQAHLPADTISSHHLPLFHGFSSNDSSSKQNDSIIVLLSANRHFHKYCGQSEYISDQFLRYCVFLSILVLSLSFRSCLIQCRGACTSQQRFTLSLRSSNETTAASSIYSFTYTHSTCNCKTGLMRNKTPKLRFTISGGQDIFVQHKKN